MLYDPSTENVDEMNRTDLIFAIAKKAPSYQYQQIIKLPTEAIRNLLKFYRNDIDGALTVDKSTITPAYKN